MCIRDSNIAGNTEYETDLAFAGEVSWVTHHVKPGAEWDEAKADDSCQACAEVSVSRLHDIEEKECQHGKHWRVKKVRPQTHSLLSAEHNRTPLILSSCESETQEKSIVQKWSAGPPQGIPLPDNQEGTRGELPFLYFRPCSARYFLSFSRCTTVRWVLIFSQLGPSRGYQRRMTAQASRSTAGTRNHARTMPASAEALCMPFANDWYRPLVDGCPMAMDGTPFLRPLCPQGTACVRTVEMRLGPRTHPGSST